MTGSEHCDCAGTVPGFGSRSHRGTGRGRDRAVKGKEARSTSPAEKGKSEKKQCHKGSQRHTSRGEARTRRNLADLRGPIVSGSTNELDAEIELLGR